MDDYSLKRRPLKVLTVFGTRPEAIKLAPVIKELQRRSEQGYLQSSVCVTGQHRQMLDQVLRLFGIVPDFDLNVMKANQSPAYVAAAVLTKLTEVLEAQQPDWVLVQGDTATAAAAALAAFYARARVGHVEAGLRSGDKWQPFPEEINRRVAGAIADLHFAPTDCSRANLLHEGVRPECILVTGNPVVDDLHWVVCQIEQGDMEDYRSEGLELLRVASPETRVVLVTAHRRENFGPPFEQVCLGIRDLALRYSQKLLIVYPVHPNPNVCQPAHRMLGGIGNVLLLPPLDYLPLVYLLSRCYLVLTDSGGIQEEAPGLGKPVLVLRDVTERPEGVDAGTVRLVGTSRERIVAEATRLLDDSAEYERMARAVNPYGDGRAAYRIVGALLGEEVSQFRSQAGLAIAG